MGGDLMHLGQQIFEYADKIKISELKALQDLLYVQNIHNEAVRNGNDRKKKKC